MKPTTFIDLMKSVCRKIIAGALGALISFALPAAIEAQPMGPHGPIIIHGAPPPTHGSSSSHGNSSSSAQKNNGVWIPSTPASVAAGTNDIQLSLQNANIDMVVQWLAQTTGKTVIKSPKVQCQLTIASPKKVPVREAINLVYSALALQGYTVVESSDSILIVPKDEQLNMSPKLLGSSQKNIPEGRERLMKVFPLKHARAAVIMDRVRAALSADATVDVDEADNEIIITDYNDNLRVAGELIAALDANHPEDVTIRVIALKHMSATDLAKELTPIYQKMVGKNSQETIDVAADDRSNSLLILSSASTFKTLEQIVALLDTEGAQEKVIRTFVLKNADAQDVAQQLQQLNEGQQNNSSYPFIFFTSSRPRNNPKGVSIVADRRRNAVIVQAPPAQMDGIAKMIKELDAAIPGESLAPLIYHLKYSSASDVEAVLDDLFVNQQQNRNYFYYFGNSSSSQNQYVGRLYGKVRIASEPYSNTIIVTANSAEDLEAVKSVIQQLDEPSEGGESTLRVGLKFAKASTVANDLNILFAQQGSPPLRPTTPQNQPNSSSSQSQPQQGSTALESGFNLEAENKEEAYYPWLGGQPSNFRSGNGRNGQMMVSDLVGRVRAVADDRGNALLLSANIHFFPEILKLLEEMDAPSDQVAIEARIIEVSSDYLNKLGVRWSPNGSQVFTADDYDNSLLLHTSAEYQKGFGGNTSVNVPPASSSTLTQVLTELRSGVLASTINVDYLIQFLRKTTGATVLGDPQITISDNEMGKLFVGQEVPIPQNTTFSSVGSQNTSFVYKDVGVVLEVTPHINDTGDVQLRIHAESSTIVPGQTILGGVVINTRNFRTDLTAKDGQTLVLGGIIQKQISNTLRKTPILGSIPGLGWLFKKKDQSTENVELMVFLHPKVIRSPEDAKSLLKQMEKRAPEMKQWESNRP